MEEGRGRFMEEGRGRFMEEGRGRFIERSGTADICWEVLRNGDMFPGPNWCVQMRVMHARIGRKLSPSLGGEDSQVLWLEMQHEAFVGGPVVAPGVLVEPILGPGEVHRGERGGGEGRRGGKVFMASTHTVETRDASHTLRACMDKVSCLSNVESFTDCSCRRSLPTF